MNSGVRDSEHFFAGKLDIEVVLTLYDRPHLLDVLWCRRQIFVTILRYQYVVCTKSHKYIGDPMFRHDLPSIRTPPTSQYFSNTFSSMNSLCFSS